MGTVEKAASGATEPRRLSSVEWIGEEDGFLRLLDQTALPHDIAFRDCRTPEAVAEAITSLRVRGAPAIGTAAAYGVVVGLDAAGRSTEGSTTAVATDATVEALHATASLLRRTRPTAVNLFGALDRQVAATLEAAPRGPAAMVARALEIARAIEREDAAACAQMAAHGAALIPPGAGVITHCHTGALATAGSGTALGVILRAHADGKDPHVYIDETRPLLQGARLTAFEVVRAGARGTLICDGAAAQVIAEGRIDVAFVGADRIAANGDTANKIGTLGLALAAAAKGVPFYVVAPTTTIDSGVATGADIPIEQRHAQEITTGPGGTVAADGIGVYNPAFDVTPAALIRGIVTEKGVLSPPFDRAIAAALSP